jgi:hypothetical protein
MLEYFLKKEGTEQMQKNHTIISMRGRLIHIGYLSKKIKRGTLTCQPVDEKLLPISVQRPAHFVTLSGD